MRKAENLPPSCAVVMKSGSLNFLEPSGPLQACNGTALPLHAWAYTAYTIINTPVRIRTRARARTHTHSLTHSLTFIYAHCRFNTFMLVEALGQIYPQITYCLIQ